MSDYRRWRVEGAMVFLTIVTHGRRKILTTEAGRRILRSAIEGVRERHPFDCFASALLLDHRHLIMRLPTGDAGYALRIKRVKEEFTLAWRAGGFAESEVTQSQRARGERGVWQPRFWEHTIRDDADLERCVDYLHWNPRKHGLVDRVRDYPWSSFHRFVKAGDYPIDWGGAETAFGIADQDWGGP